MINFISRAHEKGVLPAFNTHGLFVRLGQQPLAQRKALFFATFIISGALVFSFWTSQMYRNFGIVFWGGASGRPAQELAGSPASKIAEVTPGNVVGGLKGPFEVARENASFLKEEFINLFSGISSGLKAVEYNGLPDNGAVQKEPPVVAFGITAEQQNPSAEIQKTAEIKISPTTPLSSALPKAEPAPAASGSKTLAENTGVKEPPLLVYTDAKQNQYNLIFSGSENSENNGPKRGVPTEALARNAEEKKTRRVVSIVMANLASMRQAFSDLYDYLTQ